MSSLRWTQDKTVNILDERLNHEFHDALALLATGTDDQRRSVMLHFAGIGRRDVRVGYVMEAPIWKISYRLLLGGDGAAAKPYLQGWALVENTTDEDWNNVNLSLVSGRPVSFIQDLYQPLYIPRPVVGPDIVASPYPQTHDEGLTSVTALNNAQAADVSGALRSLYAPIYSGGIGGQHGARPAVRRTYSGNSHDPLVVGAANKPAEAKFTVGNAEFAKQSVDAQAAGEKAGELFQYNISTPISLPRQQASMIPVIAQDIETEKVSLYNADTGPKFPMNAIRAATTHHPRCISKADR